MNRPEGGCEAQRDYFKKELERIEGYFRKNREFYHYYRSGNTYMDEMFFLRSSKPEFHLHLETFHFERDMAFSTNCDYKVSKILANSLIESYINSELDRLEYKGNSTNNNSPSSNFKSGLIWTGSKIDLLEIAYAIDTAQCINYGKTQLKQIVALFENIFNIELESNLSRAFYDLRIRKDRTSFLNKLTYLLCDRMDKADN
jgi:Asp-tRNA(Asn)/Glu-tRNA(Gln) amidotransferase C subunit